MTSRRTHQGRTNEKTSVSPTRTLAVSGRNERPKRKLELVPELVDKRAHDEGKVNKNYILAGSLYIPRNIMQMISTENVSSSGNKDAIFLQSKTEEEDEESIKVKDPELRKYFQRIIKYSDYAPDEAISTVRKASYDVKHQARSTLQNAASEDIEVWNSDIVQDKGESSQTEDDVTDEDLDMIWWKPPGHDKDLSATENSLPCASPPSFLSRVVGKLFRQKKSSQSSYQRSHEKNSDTEMRKKCGSMLTNKEIKLLEFLTEPKAPSANCITVMLISQIFNKTLCPKAFIKMEQKDSLLNEESRKSELPDLNSSNYTLFQQLIYIMFFLNCNELVRIISTGIRAIILLNKPYIVIKLNCAEVNKKPNELCSWKFETGQGSLDWTSIHCTQLASMGIKELIFENEIFVFHLTSENGMTLSGKCCCPGCDCKPKKCLPNKKFSIIKCLCPCLSKRKARQKELPDATTEISFDSSQIENSPGKKHKSSQTERFHWNLAKLRSKWDKLYRKKSSNSFNKRKKFPNRIFIHGETRPQGTVSPDSFKTPKFNEKAQEEHNSPWTSREKWKEAWTNVKDYSSHKGHHENGPESYAKRDEGIVSDEGTVSPDSFKIPKFNEKAKEEHIYPWTSREKLKEAWTNLKEYRSHKGLHEKGPESWAKSRNINANSERPRSKSLGQIGAIHLTTNKKKGLTKSHSEIFLGSPNFDKGDFGGDKGKISLSNNNRFPEQKRSVSTETIEFHRGRNHEAPKHSRNTEKTVKFSDLPLINKADACCGTDAEQDESGEPTDSGGGSGTPHQGGSNENIHNETGSEGGSLRRENSQFNSTNQQRSVLNRNSSPGGNSFNLVIGQTSEYAKCAYISITNVEKVVLCGPECLNVNKQEVAASIPKTSKDDTMHQERKLLRSTISGKEDSTSYVPVRTKSNISHVESVHSEQRTRPKSAESILTMHTDKASVGEEESPIAEKLHDVKFSSENETREFERETFNSQKDSGIDSSLLETEKISNTSTHMIPIVVSQPSGILSNRSGSSRFRQTETVREVEVEEVEPGMVFEKHTMSHRSTTSDKGIHLEHEEPKASKKEPSGSQLSRGRSRSRISTIGAVEEEPFMEKRTMSHRSTISDKGIHLEQEEEPKASKRASSESHLSRGRSRSRISTIGAVEEEPFMEKRTMSHRSTISDKGIHLEQEEEPKASKKASSESHLSRGRSRSRISTIGAVEEEPFMEKRTMSHRSTISDKGVHLEQEEEPKASKKASSESHLSRGRSRSHIRTIGTADTDVEEEPETLISKHSVKSEIRTRSRELSKKPSNVSTKSEQDVILVEDVPEVIKVKSTMSQVSRSSQASLEPLSRQATPSALWADIKEEPQEMEKHSTTSQIRRTGSREYSQLQRQRSTMSAQEIGIAGGRGKYSTTTQGSKSRSQGSLGHQSRKLTQNDLGANIEEEPVVHTEKYTSTVGISRSWSHEVPVSHKSVQVDLEDDEPELIKKHSAISQGGNSGLQEVSHHRSNKSTISQVREEEMPEMVIEKSASRLSKVSHKSTKTNEIDLPEEQETVIKKYSAITQGSIVGPEDTLEYSRKSTKSSKGAESHFSTRGMSGVSQKSTTSKGRTTSETGMQKFASTSSKENTNPHCVRVPPESAGKRTLVCYELDENGQVISEVVMPSPIENSTLSTFLKHRRITFSEGADGQQGEGQRMTETSINDHQLSIVSAGSRSTLVRLGSATSENERKTTMQSPGSSIGRSSAGRETASSIRSSSKTSRDDRNSTKKSWFMNKHSSQSQTDDKKHCSNKCRCLRSRLRQRELAQKYGNSSKGQTEEEFRSSNNVVTSQKSGGQDTNSKFGSERWKCKCRARYEACESKREASRTVKDGATKPREEKFTPKFHASRPRDAETPMKNMFDCYFMFLPGNEKTKQSPWKNVHEKYKETYEQKTDYFPMLYKYNRFNFDLKTIIYMVLSPNIKKKKIKSVTFEDQLGNDRFPDQFKKSNKNMLTQPSFKLPARFCPIHKHYKDKGSVKHLQSSRDSKLMLEEGKITNPKTNLTEKKFCQGKVVSYKSVQTSDTAFRPARPKFLHASSRVSKSIETVRDNNTAFDRKKAKSEEEISHITKGRIEKKFAKFSDPDIFRRKNILLSKTKACQTDMNFINEYEMEMESNKNWPHISKDVGTYRMSVEKKLRNMLENKACTANLDAFPHINFLVESDKIKKKRKIKKDSQDISRTLAIATDNSSETCFIGTGIQSGSSEGNSHAKREAISFSGTLIFEEHDKRSQTVYKNVTPRNLYNAHETGMINKKQKVFHHERHRNEQRFLPFPSIKFLPKNDNKELMFYQNKNSSKAPNEGSRESNKFFQQTGFCYPKYNRRNIMYSAQRSESIDSSDDSISTIGDSTDEESSEDNEGNGGKCLFSTLAINSFSKQQKGGNNSPKLSNTSRWQNNSVDAKEFKKRRDRFELDETFKRKRNDKKYRSSKNTDREVYLERKSSSSEEISDSSLQSSWTGSNTSQLLGSNDVDMAWQMLRKSAMFGAGSNFTGPVIEHVYSNDPELYSDEE